MLDLLDIYVLLFVSVFYIKQCDVPNFRATIKDASNHSIRSPEEILKVKWFYTTKQFISISSQAKEQFQRNSNCAGDWW